MSLERTEGHAFPPDALCSASFLASQASAEQRLIPSLCPFLVCLLSDGRSEQKTRGWDLKRKEENLPDRFGIAEHWKAAHFLRGLDLCIHRLCV